MARPRKKEFTQMSIQNEVKLAELERKLVEQRIELMAQIAALQVRLETLEAAKGKRNG
jgi:hypothetical protein